MTSTDGIVIDDRLVIKSDASGPRSARMVLQNPRVDFAVFEVARGGILREGLGYSRNDVAVVLNVAPDHLGLRGIDTVEQLAQVKQVIVEAVPKNGAAVLNADDPLVAGMRRRLVGGGGLVLDQAGQPDDLRPLPARRQGGHPGTRRTRRPDHAGARPAPDAARLHPSAARDVRRQGDVQRAERDGRGRRRLLRRRAPAGHPRRAAVVHPVVLLGARPDEHDRGARASRSSSTTATTRRRWLRSAISSTGSSRTARRGSGRSGSASIATAGDRRDQDMIDLGREAAKHFDRIIVREDVRLRGRAPGETAGLIVQGAKQAQAEGCRLKQIEVVLDEIEATKVGVEWANPGDLVVVCVDRARAVWDELQALGQRAQAGAADEFGDN